MIKAPRYLLDVNVLIALLDENHEHHPVALRWFTTRPLLWSLCALTEAGLLRYLTRPSTGRLSMKDAGDLLMDLAKSTDHRYQPINADWARICKPLSERLFGYKQITDAYLLGLAIHENLILATFDKALVHLAGEHSRHLLLLE